MLYLNNDYMAGAHPAVLKRLVDTNLEHTIGYGLDDYSIQAAELIRAECALPDARVFFLCGGTQTNAVAIDALLASHEGVLAAESAHINVHECGAIEASGHKVLTLKDKEGKVSAEQLCDYLTQFYADETYEHMVTPGMVYLTYPTEYGTLYTLKELSDISAVCNKYSIPLYIDGARMAYALAAQPTVTLKDIARLCDAFYIGGTKCGTLFGEALVVKNQARFRHLFSLIKQHGALIAKGRLAALQFTTLFTANLYYNIGTSAVQKAMLLRETFENKGFKAFINSYTNQQFFALPNELLERLKTFVSFEYWGAPGEKESVVRFVTSWSTCDSEFDEFIKTLREL